MEPSKTTPTSTGSRELPKPTEGGASIPRDAKELASDVVDRAKDLATEQVSERREKSAGEISKLADALHRTGEEIGDTMAGPYVEKAADMLDRLSDSVRDGSVR